MDTLFDTAKTGVFLDSITHSTENRRGTDTKVVVLGCRVDPLDAKLALSLDQRVRNTLFRLGDAEAAGHIRSCEFALGVPTQNLAIFASPDTEKASRALLQVKITGIRAKVDKDQNHYSLVFKASFGPADKDELLFVEEWRGSQRFLTFQRVEPELELDIDDEMDAAPVNGRPAPIWEDGDQPEPQPETETAREVGAKLPAKRGRKKTAKHNPEAERASQVAAVKGKPNGAAHA
jgi:hypothetical protein